MQQTSPKTQTQLLYFVVFWMDNLTIDSFDNMSTEFEQHY